MTRLNVNGQSVEVEVDGTTPLLWVIREQLGLTGTKYGCGVAQCGACTVHIDGVATRSCMLPVSEVDAGAADRHHRGPVARRLASGAEGLARARRAAMRLLPDRHDHGRGGAARAERRRPTDADIDSEITNICRCGTYGRVRRRDQARRRRPATPSARAEAEGSRNHDDVARRIAPFVPRRQRRRPRRPGARLPRPAGGGRREAERPRPRPRSTSGWWCSPTTRW